MTIFVQRVVRLVRILLSLGSWRPFLGWRPRWPGRRAGAGANKLASSRNRVTKQTCWRTEAINPSAAKLESATMTMARSVSQRLVCKTACRAQSVSFLWRRPRASLQRCEGAKIVRKGKAQPPDKGDLHRDHQAEPAQATGLDEMPMRRAHWVSVDPARRDLWPPTTLDRIIHANHD